MTNLSGNAQLVQPMADNQKYGVPTTSSLGITDASQIGVLFNATEPGGDGITVQDVTLKFYSSSGTLLGAIDGSQTFAGTNPGNGSAGFVFRVSADEQAQVNSWLMQGGGDTRVALEASLQRFAGGPESFVIYNAGGSVPAVPEPETYALMALGLAGIGLVARRRKARASA